MVQQCVLQQCVLQPLNYYVATQCCNMCQPTTAYVRGGRFGQRCAVLPRNMLLCLVPSCDQSSTWGYLCANGRTGHAVGVALVLSDAPFNLKLAITVTRVLPIPCVLFTCRSLHWSLDPCLGIVVRPRRCTTHVPDNCNRKFRRCIQVTAFSTPGRCTVGVSCHVGLR